MLTKRRDYAAEAVAAARSVLIELVQVLGEFRDQMVVVGGWVPVLLLRDAPEAHVGTLDIDLALDFPRIPEAAYATLLKALIDRGYRQDPRQPFRFFRDVSVPGRAPIVVEVDLLAGDYGGTGPGHRTQPVQDTRARKARGCDLVFAHPGWDIVEYAVHLAHPEVPMSRLDVAFLALITLAASLAAEAQQAGNGP